MKKVFLFVFMMISIFFLSSCSGLGDFKFKNWYDINSYSEFKLTGNLKKIQSNDYNTTYNVNLIKLKYCLIKFIIMIN